LHTGECHIFVENESVLSNKITAAKSKITRQQQGALLATAELGNPGEGGWSGGMVEKMSGWFMNRAKLILLLLKIY